MALLDRGADFTIQDAQAGSYPLHAAAFNNRITCLAALIKRGAAVDCQDHNDATPLHNAAFNGHIECCEVLSLSLSRVIYLSAFYFSCCWSIRPIRMRWMIVRQPHCMWLLANPIWMWPSYLSHAAPNPIHRYFSFLFLGSCL